MTLKKCGRESGKPDEVVLHLSILDKDVNELRKLRMILSEFYDEYDLSLLSEWIVWKSKNAI